MPFSMSGRGGPLGVPDGSVDDRGGNLTFEYQTTIYKLGFLIFFSIFFLGA